MYICEYVCYKRGLCCCVGLCPIEVLCHCVVLWSSPTAKKSFYRYCLFLSCVNLLQSAASLLWEFGTAHQAVGECGIWWVGRLCEWVGRLCEWVGRLCEWVGISVSGWGVSVSGWGVSVSRWGVSVSGWGVSVSGWDISVSGWGVSVSGWGICECKVVSQCV